MATTMDLKINRDLIDPGFEGYKLSLDKLSTYSSELDSGFYQVQLSDDQFSYHHAKLFGVNNLLTLDPWNTDSVYYIDKDWNVKRATAHDSSLECDKIVCQVPDASNQQLVPGRYCAQVCLVSPELGIFCDGAGQLHVVNTGERQKTNETWKVLMSKTVPDEKQPCRLVDAVLYSVGESHRLESLLVHVAEATPEEKDKYRSQYLAILEWVTFTSVDQKAWSFGRSRQLVCRKPFSYASLSRVGGAVTVAGEAEFIFTRDSEIPVVSDEEKEAEIIDERPPDYTWLQTQEDVSVQFTVPTSVTKADIYLTLKTNHIDFGIKNSGDLLKGPLHAEIDVESSTWTIDGQRVDLLLGKKEEGMWPLVVQGDTRGEMVPDATQIAAIHERLAHLTSEDMNPPCDQEEKPYNSQQLEECDMFPDDNFLFMRIDGDTHKITHKSHLGSHQWLFNTWMGTSSPPAVCLRHDVDGLLWQPADSPQASQVAWTHIATFNAFGYVQASKQQRLFTVNPPDNSYVVIADNVRHIYLYRQSSPVATPLRNRKTGQQVSSVAKQQVISLETTDNILGMQATNSQIFVATNNKLYMIKT